VRRAAVIADEYFCSRDHRNQFAYAQRTQTWQLMFSCSLRLGQLRALLRSRRAGHHNLKTSCDQRFSDSRETLRSPAFGVKLVGGRERRVRLFRIDTRLAQSRERRFAKLWRDV